MLVRCTIKCMNIFLYYYSIPNMPLQLQVTPCTTKWAHTMNLELEDVEVYVTLCSHVTSLFITCSVYKTNIASLLITELKTIIF